MTDLETKLARLRPKDRAKVQKLLAKADQPPSAPTLCRRWLIANPRLTTNQLVERLRQNGHPNAKTATINALRWSTLGFLRELVDHGKVPESIYHQE